ncbi:MAG: PD40 domain-containing protein [Crocinitomicaceae bacterium]|nr:PD40 domain-containing protein [Crocinitomicaceae bacterium]
MKTKLITSAFYAIIGSLYSQNQNIIIAERDTLRIEIEKLGNEINSDFDDYAPVITADGEYMYFTSRRPLTAKEIKRNRTSDERIYEAIWNYQTESWYEATALGKELNAPGRNISNVAISNDGYQMLIYQDNRFGIGNIYETILAGNRWSSPTELSINSENHESSASISPDGRTIYFVSDRKGGEGKRDIWKATKDAKGNWGKPENLGSNINTKYDEEAVYIHPDGKTLYFSSKGHNSIGGYDVFKSELVDGTWSKPVNLGEPINTSEDEIFYVLSADGRTAYYTTSREGGVRNIYQIRFTPIDKAYQVTSKGPKLTVLKGVVSDKETGFPLGASIEVTDNEKNEVIATYNANSSTGKYLVSLPAGKNYGINVSAEGYLFSSYSFDLTIDSLSVYNEVRKDVEMEKLKVGTRVVLRNIFFDYDKANLRNESISELNKLKRILETNPTVKVEIGGHTDSRGSEEYNIRLSKDRAHAVVNFLIENGISKDRLTYKGYGKSQPIATNETPEGRQENRRVEFRILSN